MRVTSTEAQLTPFKNPLLAREALLQKLHSYREMKLIFIHAPAGYGKTVLLQQFASRINTPVLKYQLDSMDNDPVVFFRHFLQNLTYQGNCISELDFLKYITKPVEFLAIMSRLADRLAEQFTVNTTLILEDFHLLKNRIFSEWMNTFIRYLPTGTQLIISSRHAPALKLAKLKLEGLGVEIGPQELKLDEYESKSLLAFSPQLKTAPELTSRIIEQTTGWAAGMVLFLKWLAKQDPAKKVDWELLRQGYPDIYNYFENEVFADLDSVFQQDLTKLAVVGEFTPELAKLLLKRDDGRLFLEEALAGHCFIIREDETGEVYRYHPLFREFLLSRIRESKILLHQAGLFFYSGRIISRRFIMLLKRRIISPRRKLCLNQDWIFYAGGICP